LKYFNGFFFAIQKDYARDQNHKVAQTVPPSDIAAKEYYARTDVYATFFGSGINCIDGQKERS
jgi:hypothetical protein